MIISWLPWNSANPSVNREQLNKKITNVFPFFSFAQNWTIIYNFGFWHENRRVIPIQTHTSLWTLIIIVYKNLLCRHLKSRARSRKVTEADFHRQTEGYTEVPNVQKINGRKKQIYNNITTWYRFGTLVFVFYSSYRYIQIVPFFGYISDV